MYVKGKVCIEVCEGTGASQREAINCSSSRPTTTRGTYPQSASLYLPSLFSFLDTRIDAQYYHNRTLEKLKIKKKVVGSVNLGWLRKCMIVTTWQGRCGWS
jgi:hypothetical protein